MLLAPGTVAPCGQIQDELTSFRREALLGLRQPHKRLPCKFFYDEIGSRLFDRICDLPEYYLTRTELSIMRRHAQAMARLIGPECQVIEYGSGSSVKSRLLLDALASPAGYVPVDISGKHLAAAAARLAAAYPHVEVLPVCADYSESFDVPESTRPARRRVAYFPGSTIGNFEPRGAVHFLQQIARTLGPDGGLLIGVDLKKDPARIHAAYNDAAGVTAEFNLNLLARMNRELGCDFDLGRFRHYALYHPVAGRIEMHLVSAADQLAHLDGAEISIGDGESIHTENSYKYTPREFERLAAAADFVPAARWTDDRNWFCVAYFVRRDEK